MTRIGVDQDEGGDTGGAGTTGTGKTIATGILETQVDDIDVVDSHEFLMNLFGSPPQMNVDASPRREKQEARSEKQENSKPIIFLLVFCLLFLASISYV
jgi:hypothetical protein